MLRDAKFPWVNHKRKGVCVECRHRFPEEWGADVKRERRFSLNQNKTDGLCEDLEILAWLEANRFAGVDCDFGAGARVAADACLAGLDGEDAKAAKLDAVAAAEGRLHRFEDGVDCGLRFDSRQSRPFYDSLNQILFNQGVSPS